MSTASIFSIPVSDMLFFVGLFSSRLIKLYQLNFAPAAFSDPFIEYGISEIMIKSLVRTLEQRKIP